jgi:hypothetical protein
MARNSRSPIPRRAWLAAIFLCGTPAAAFEAGSPLETALDFFTRDGPAGLVGRLDAARPLPVSAAERDRVLATLPDRGEVVALKQPERERLAALRRVLELHGRQTVYVVKVIDVPQAAVALHARTVVLVSRPALGLLEPDELQALVAHEIGHEYFWREYLQARRDQDRLRLQTLELLSDGLAIVTLRRAGIDQARLMAALEKLVRYNRDRFGPARNENDYPAVGERRRFARHLTRWLTRDPP